MPNAITPEIAKLAKDAVRAPVPIYKPKDYGKTRDDWRKHQDGLPVSGKRHLPSELFIEVEGVRGWKYYSPFGKDGAVKPPEGLRETAARLKRYGEQAWFVHGEDNKDGSRNVIGVILDGSMNGSPYLMVAADRPDSHVTVDSAGVRFRGAKRIENADGVVIDGDRLEVAVMPPVTLRCHDKGGSCAIADAKVDVKGKCEVENSGGEVTLNGERVGARPVAAKVRGR